MTHLVIEKRGSEYFIIDPNNLLLDDGVIEGPFPNAKLAEIAMYSILMRTDCKSGKCGD